MLDCFFGCISHPVNPKARLVDSSLPLPLIPLQGGRQVRGDGDVAPPSRGETEPADRWASRRGLSLGARLAANADGKHLFGKRAFGHCVKQKVKFNVNKLMIIVSVYIIIVCAQSLKSKAMQWGEKKKNPYYLSCRRRIAPCRAASRSQR